MNIRPLPPQSPRKRGEEESISPRMRGERNGVSRFKGGV